MALGHPNWWLPWGCGTGPLAPFLSGPLVGQSCFCSEPHDHCVVASMAFGHLNGSSREGPNGPSDAAGMPLENPNEEPPG
eukprot:6865417-Pyramimonas_sp.AAC.1